MMRTISIQIGDEARASGCCITISREAARAGFEYDAPGWQTPIASLSSPRCRSLPARSFTARWAPAPSSMPPSPTQNRTAGESASSSATMPSGGRMPAAAARRSTPGP